MSWLGKKLRHVGKLARNPRRLARSFAHAHGELAVFGQYRKTFGSKGMFGRKVHPINLIAGNMGRHSFSSSGVAASSYNAGNGYVYSGKSLSEMM